MHLSTHYSADTFPRWEQAPEDLKALAANCGPLSLWLVAKALGRDLDTASVIRACRFIPGEGMWPIRLALAFKELGFAVEFRSHSVHLPEGALLPEMKENGLAILPPMSLKDLLKAPGITVLGYDVIDGGGHFSPVLRIDDRTAYLPLDYAASVQAIEIVERQRKQCDLETINVVNRILPSTS